jgi:long-chain acyl-CoA synthetase
VLFYGPDYQSSVDEVMAQITAIRRCIPLTEYPECRDAGIDGPVGDPGFEPGPADVITQLYTSGTTGLPKGVMISGLNLATILSGAVETFRIGADTVSMVAMPLFHIGGTGWALSGM